jgi:hypothetical protein
MITRNGALTMTARNGGLSMIVLGGQRFGGAAKLAKPEGTSKARRSCDQLKSS